MSDDDGERLRQLLRAKVRGGGGIAVIHSPNGDITITDQRRRSGGGGGRSVTEQRVIVRQVGGEAGSITEKCSYTYDGWMLGSDPDADPVPAKLFEEMEPIDGRMAFGKYMAPPSEEGGRSFGMAIFDATESEWLLWYVPGEVPGTSPCQPCEP